MNELQKVFKFQGNQVRTILREGEPWFVAKDVCDILGLEQVPRAMDRLDDDEGGLLKVTHPQTQEKEIEVNAVNEPGLYRLIFNSNKSEAKAFKHWVFHEVLPSIRKTGKYELAANTDTKIKQLTGQVKEMTEMLEIYSDQITSGFLDHNLDYLTEKEACKVFKRPNGFFRSELVYDGYLKSEWGVLRITEKGKEFGEEFFVSGRRKNPFSFRWRREVFEGIVKKWDDFAKPPGGSD